MVDIGHIVSTHKDFNGWLLTDTGKLEAYYGVLQSLKTMGLVNQHSKSDYARPQSLWYKNSVRSDTSWNQILELLRHVHEPGVSVSSCVCVCESGGGIQWVGSVLEWGVSTSQISKWTQMHVAMCLCACSCLLGNQAVGSSISYHPPSIPRWPSTPLIMLWPSY
jgi:hypothetical protein